MIIAGSRVVDSSSAAGLSCMDADLGMGSATVFPRNGRLADGNHIPHAEQQQTFAQVVLERHQMSRTLAAVLVKVEEKVRESSSCAG